MAAAYPEDVTRIPVLRAGGRTVGFAWTFLRREFLLEVLLSAVCAFLPAVQVLLVARLTSAILSGDRPRATAYVVGAALAVGLAAALSDVAAAGWRVVMITTRNRMSSVLVERMANLPPSLISDPEWSARGQEARESIQQHGSTHLNAIVGAAQGVITAVSLVIALCTISAPAALLILVSLVPVLAGYMLTSRMEDGAFVEQTRLARSARYLQDQLTYQRPASELIALGSSRRVAGWYADLMERIHDGVVKLTRRQTLVLVLGGLVTTVALAGALALVGLGSHASPGGAAGGAVAVLSATAVMRTTGNSLGAIMTGSGPVARYFDFLDATEDFPLPNAQPPQVRELAVSNLSYVYPNATRPALDAAGLTVRQGEMIALVGANGAGKTTLINLLLGTLAPDRGSVTLDGRDVTTMPEAERLATFSLLTQEFGRYELTVRDTVLLGTPRNDVRDDEVWAALETARAATFVRELPDGLDTQLGQQWGGVGLSGGQWQRIALARIAVRQAPIWLLDEPTSSVDAETEQDIFDELGQHRGERITIVVSHRAWTLRGMDRIIVLDRGRIVQVGTYAELMAAPGRFRDMFEQQDTAR